MEDDEKRKNLRVDCHCVVSFRLENAYEYDMSQTKDLSKDGIMLTTNGPFDVGCILCMYIMFPFFPQKMAVKGEVLESVPFGKGKCFNRTRLKFLNLDKEFIEKLDEFIKIKDSK
ncbi:MAG: PilZ domain-containing protein [Candidatus Omnitrophica bacterium]|nr:PilZ domain-containing protein [Candidatus Omnitrophota bacterium]MCK5491503.1 PilZ domain-containing protein [Candidatus Omnitrophota bacterium]